MSALTHKRKLIIGNWKLNGSITQNQRLLTELKNGLAELNAADFVVCPPFPYLSQVSNILQASNILLGAQNVSNQDSGAFTGEVSASMLAEASCQYVIIGHMERRTLYAESDALIKAKLPLIRSAGMIPVLCVGETLEQRDAGVERDVIAKQIEVLREEMIQGSEMNVVVAYEPGWAIGTGRTAEVEQVYEIHKFIYECLQAMAPDRISFVRVLYGGSIKSDNAHSLFSTQGIDGGLVGGASLDSQNFILICRAACGLNMASIKGI